MWPEWWTGETWITRLQKENLDFLWDSGFEWDLLETSLQF